jgi:hypothetical protein
MRNRNFASIVCLTVFSTSFGTAAEQLPPVRAGEKVTALASVFDISNWDKPLVIKSEEQARKHFDERNLAALLEQVDFDEQLVLIFAWQGSGQDRLEIAMVQSSPERIQFRYRPGKTRDLRPHVRIFAVRSDVIWGDQQPPAEEPAEYVRVTVKGKLKTGLVAIGGETTGTAITADGITWELELGQNEALLDHSRQLDGQTVLVRGRLRRTPGVEIRERWIVTVRSLEPAAK